MITSEKKAIRNTIRFYANELGYEIRNMTDSEITDHLGSDVFIGIASAATGIPEEDFIQAAPGIIKEIRKEEKK